LASIAGKNREAHNRIHEEDIMPLSFMEHFLIQA